MYLSDYLFHFSFIIYLILDILVLHVTVVLNVKLDF